MRLTQLAIFVPILTVCSAHCQTTIPPAPLTITTQTAAGEGIDSALVGTWTMGEADSGAQFTVRLTLRSDGTYTKTLKGKSGGLALGGTHSGTWTSEGTVVHLSGDGNWPAYNHDLRQFSRA